MKIPSVLCLALVLGLFAAGCTKDSSTTAPSSSGPSISALVGKWQVLSGMQYTSYLTVHSDNLYFLLHQYSYGLRSMEAGVAQVANGTIDLGLTNYNSGQSVFNYAISGDTLRLTAPGQSIVCLSSTTAPSDSDWVKSLAILDTMSPPINTPTDMAIIGDTMWYGNAYASHNLYKINLTTRTVDTLPTTNYAWAVEWDGTNLWTSSDGDGSIFKLNPSTGATISTSVAMGAWIYGIAWDGNVLWCTSNNEQSVYRYNPATNTVLTTYPLGSGVSPAGLAFANGWLYTVVNGVINQCTLSPFGTSAAYQIPGITAVGIAYDGTNFWVSGYDANDKTMLYKVSLQ